MGEGSKPAELNEQHESIYGRVRQQSVLVAIDPPLQHQPKRFIGPLWQMILQ